MTRLRVAFLFVAVVAGDYAVLILVNGQLIDFGVAAAICAGSTVAAALIAYADRRRRKAVALGRAPVWERRDQQAAAADQQRASCGGERQKPKDATRFVERQGTRLCGVCAPARNHTAGTMSPRRLSAPVLTSEQPERARRRTARPPSASRDFGWGGVEQPMTPAWKC